MRKGYNKTALISACIGTLALNMVLFILLPGLVRNPEMDIGPAYSKPVPVQMPQQMPTTTEALPPDNRPAPQTTPERQPPPSPQVPPLQPEPDFAPLLSGLDDGISLPPTQFTPAGAGEVYTDDVATAIAPAPQVYESKALDQPVRPIAQTPFIYPLRAKRQEIEGWVRVALQVGMEGNVEAVEILDAAPEGVFEQSVTRGIRNWRFSPATVMGEKVRTRVVTTIRFELKD